MRECGGAGNDEEPRRSEKRKESHNDGQPLLILLHVAQYETYRYGTGCLWVTVVSIRTGLRGITGMHSTVRYRYYNGQSSISFISRFLSERFELKLYSFDSLEIGLET